jgi:ATP-binding cassette subfamily B protein
MDWRIGLMTLGITFIQLIYIAWSSSKANKYRKQSHEVYRKLTGEVADEVTNIVAFKSGGMEKEAQGRIAALGKEETMTFWLRRRNTTLLDIPRNLLTGIGVAIAFYMIVSNAESNPTAVGFMILAFMYIFQIIRNFSELPSLLVQHDDLITKAHPTLAYLNDIHEEIKDPARPKKLRATKGAIDIKAITFSYPSGSKTVTRIPVFENLTITIKGGEHIGIVGLSGAGKSTLTSLLMRFDDIDSGSITIDGQDIRQVRQSELRRNIAYVPQEPLLFHRTIAENIAYFNPQATEKEIIKAAKAAHAHEFISKLPDGYDTIVGERGVKLSGGQKQRVVIARIVLKNAPIMLFDEATSALDSESEQIIQRALPKIMGKHTAIIIAHRLSTVAKLDRIIVMHQGRIIEEGTHAALLKLGGQYHSLWQKQIAND